MIGFKSLTWTFKTMGRKIPAKQARKSKKIRAPWGPLGFVPPGVMNLLLEYSRSHYCQQRAYLVLVFPLSKVGVCRILYLLPLVIGKALGLLYRVVTSKLPQKPSFQYKFGRSLLLVWRNFCRL